MESTYRGYKVFGMGPSSSGGLSLAMMLNYLEGRLAMPVLVRFVEDDFDMTLTMTTMASLATMAIATTVDSACRPSIETSF